MTSGKPAESRQQEVSEFPPARSLWPLELEVRWSPASQLNVAPEQRNRQEADAATANPA